MQKFSTFLESMERTLLAHAVGELKQAAFDLEAAVSKGSYTMGQIQMIRRSILAVVRNDLDPLAHGHMPDQRHY